jgi:hypothetical protein
VRIVTLVPPVRQVVLKVGAFIVSVHPLLVELGVKRDMWTVARGSSVLEVVQERGCSLWDVVVLEVPQGVEERVGVAILGEADAQEVLDRVTAMTSDIMIVMSIPIAPYERRDARCAFLIGGRGRFIPPEGPTTAHRCEATSGPRAGEPCLAEAGSR